VAVCKVGCWVGRGSDIIFGRNSKGTWTDETAKMAGWGIDAGRGTGGERNLGETSYDR